MAAEDPWAPFAKKYKVHEEAYEFIRQTAALDVKPYNEIGVENARKQSLNVSIALSGHVDFKGDVKEIVVPSPYSSAGIPVTVYKPAECAEVPAIWIYYHGGGLVIGSRRSHENALKVLASQSGAIIANVEYRLLPIPDAPFAPFDDANVVAKWIMENKEAVGGKPDSKVGVGGDSAGGHISVGVTNDVRGLDFQILIYPMTDPSMSNSTFEEFKLVPGLTESAINFFFENSMKHMPDYLNNPRVNGMARTNTELSPPALIVLAELDPLRGCGLDYTEKLKAAGVSVQCEVIQGVPHAFFHLVNVFKTKCPEAYGHVVKFLDQFQKRR